MNNKKPCIKTLKKGITNLNSVMSRLGIKQLRKGQDEAIATLMNLQDCYTVLPTSHGKSLIFTIPTLCYNWRTIVFTPLVALMQDHLRNLKQKGLDAAVISSGQTHKENEMALASYERSEINFLFIAPERLHNEYFKDVMMKAPPDMIAVDEAHVLSQWAVGFRSSYCRIADFIKQHEPKVVLTLTATSPKEVQDDIINIIGLDPEVKKVIYLPPRKNLKFESMIQPNDYELLNIVNEIEGSGIVYCSTVKHTHELYENIGNFVKGGALVYNGQMSKNDKFSNQEAWTSGRVRVAICTNAFGLGINKPDTRFVIIRDISGSLEELSQAVGRAGRDGKDARCIICMSDEGIKTQEFFIGCGHPPKHELESIYHAIKNNCDADNICTMSLAKLADMTNVNKFHLQSISHNLQAFKVIERIKQEKMLQIRILDNPDHERYLKYYHCIADYGVETNNSYIEIEFDFLAEQCGVTPQTMIKHLKYLHSIKAIDLIPPPSRPPIKLIGKLSDIDFEYLKNKMNDSYRKLQTVLDFYRYPDDKKHDYLTDYFFKTINCS